jgi:hypothetical protein
MAASTARAYPNPARGKSENPSLFSVRQLVESSTWPAEYRALLLVMLENNQFGTELWYSQLNLSRDLGKSYSTVRRMMRRLREGHRFGKKNVVHCEGVLEKTIDPNMRPNGKLRRSTTYRLHRQKLKLRPTREEIENRSRGALCPLPPRPEQPIRPQSAPVAPPPSQPKPEHRSAGRSKVEQPQQPKLTRRLCAQFVGQVVEVKKSYGVGFREALKIVCEGWQYTPEAALEALKFWGYKVEEPEGP